MPVVADLSSKKPQLPSYRLTNVDRDSIRDRAISASFSEREGELDLNEDGLARRAYDEVISAPQRKAARSLPAHWFRQDNCLRFNAAGLDAQLCLSGDKTLPTPYQERSGGYRSVGRLGTIQDGELAAEIRAHLDLREKLKAERKAASRALSALLQSVTSLRALESVWPEGRPYYEQLAERVGKNTAVAPRVQELNAMLGLAEAA